MGDGKHTPGPWLISDGWEPNPHAVVDTQCVYGPARIGVVAHVVMAAQDGGHREERKANARLIAAAPDLVEALKGYMHAMEGFAEAIRATTGTAYPWEAQDIERAKALAALSKAGV